jgi:Pumilio-family RNA binding repeat
VCTTSTHTTYYSSNVIEKCLENAFPAVQTLYVKELLAAPSIPLLLHDQYANYVVQRALTVAPRREALTLIDSVRPHLALIKNTSGGRRITNKVIILQSLTQRYQ